MTVFKKWLFFLVVIWGFLRIIIVCSIKKLWNQMVSFFSGLHLYWFCKHKLNIWKWKCSFLVLELWTRAIGGILEIRIANQPPNSPPKKQTNPPNLDGWIDGWFLSTNREFIREGNCLLCHLTLRKRTVAGLFGGFF